VNDRAGEQEGRLAGEQEGRRADKKTRVDTQTAGGRSGRPVGATVNSQDVK
jgi:hypothetical protein